MVHCSYDYYKKALDEISDLKKKLAQETVKAAKYSELWEEAEVDLKKSRHEWLVARATLMGDRHRALMDLELVRAELERHMTKQDSVEQLYRNNNDLIEQLDALALQRDRAEDFVRQMRRVLLDYDNVKRHPSTCCIMVDGKVTITDESCTCGSIPKLSRKLLEETLPYAVEGRRP